MTRAGRIIIVGLGPGGSDLLTAETQALLERDVVWLRTSVHPAAEKLTHPSFDEIYASAETFEEVYSTIVERLVSEAHGHGEVVYAVPGSPMVAERTVEMLLVDARVNVEVRPALSFLDLSWVALGIDPMARAVTIVDALQLRSDGAARRGPLLITQVHSSAVLDEVILTLDDSEPQSVTILKGLGTPDQAVETVAWDDLRSSVEPDHLTSLWIPELAEPIGSAFTSFELLVERLRTECPWDAEQTHSSLRPFLLEESYEVLEALDAVTADTPDAYADLEEELGDLLFQVFLHSRLASEQGQFTIADVTQGIHDKLVERHPHVFGDADADTTIANWEASKQVAKSRASAMDGIPSTLPSLMMAFKTQKRAASAGFGGPDLEWAFGDVEEELAEAKDDPSVHEVGDLLFAVVQVARMLEIDPEQALREATARFSTRFRHVEIQAKSEGLDLAHQPLEQLTELWQQAKKAVD